MPGESQRGFEERSHDSQVWLYIQVFRDMSYEIILKTLTSDRLVPVIGVPNKGCNSPIIKASTMPYGP